MLNSTKEYRFILRGFETEEELTKHVNQFIIKDPEGEKSSTKYQMQLSLNRVLTKAYREYNPGMRIVEQFENGSDVVVLGHKIYLQKGSKRKEVTLEQLENKWFKNINQRKQLLVEHNSTLLSDEEIELAHKQFNFNINKCIDESLQYLEGKRHL